MTKPFISICICHLFTLFIFQNTNFNDKQETKWSNGSCIYFSRFFLTWDLASQLWNFRVWVSYSYFKFVQSELCIYWIWCSDWLFFEYKSKARTCNFYNCETNYDSLDLNFWQLLLFFVLNLMFTSREVCVVAGYIINHYCFTYFLSNNSSKELS